MPPEPSGSTVSPSQSADLRKAADEQAVPLPISQEWGLRGTLRSRICLAGRWDEPTPVAGGELVIKVPARATMVVELRGE